MKISIIGGGNVGATLAKRLLESDLKVDVVLLDILKDVVAGKALDLLHAAPLTGHRNTITGTDDYSHIAGSGVVVITAGFPRQAGMTREDLIAKNGGILEGVIGKVKAGCPDAIVIVVTNPLDVMAYMACRKSGLPREKIFGMAGVLDASRFAYLIADELKVDYADVDAMVLGQHGPAMVPLLSRTKVKGRPLAELIDGERLRSLLDRARSAGSTVVKLLGKGSAYYAPSAALFHMIKAIVNDEKKTISVSCLAEGEYGLNDVCTGLPVILGKDGIEEIVELDLPKDELEALQSSAGSTKELIAQL